MEKDGAMQSTEEYVLDDDLWHELIEITDGAASACFQCGVCTATCPWNTVRDEPVSVRKMMRMAQVGLMNGTEELWLCTTCGQCEPSCPRGVPITDVFRGLRQVAWERREMQEGLPSLLWSVYWNTNPWFQPPSTRSEWSADLGLEPFDPDVHELLLYVGCTSSYDRRAQNVARALVQLLRAAEVSFGVLGDEEPCCGESVRALGHNPYFSEIACANGELLAEKGVKRMVAISPHCYDSFRNHTPDPSGQLEVLHYTQLLSELVADGHLELPEDVSGRVTFHDPCYLGRINGDYDSPRTTIDAIPGLERVEMPRNRVEALCCGGGGGRLWMETAAGERFADSRIQEAIDIEADVLVTACPACIACLEDSLNAVPGADLKVLDVAELAALALPPSS